MPGDPDAVVVGSGPNGLAAAIVLAAAGVRVTLYEAAGTIGGGMRSDALTLPGYVHDVCSAVHPFAAGSPFFRTLPLEQHGLQWVMPDAMLAHPFDAAPAALVERSIPATVARLGPDAHAYVRLVGRTANDWPRLEDTILSPLGWPASPFAAARFGWHALQSARDLALGSFVTPSMRALFAGVAAHGMLPLDERPSAAFGLVLMTLAHVAGWVMPRGGAQQLANALAAHLASLGGEIVTNAPIRSLDDLPAARAILCDLSPRPFLAVAGHRLPDAFRRALQRYRYGMGVFKVDWALDAPIPWRDASVARAATVHLGGTLDEISASERDAAAGRISERPFLLLVQPTLFDPSRAPDGRHTAWAYCHVPSGASEDMLSKIEAQIERFAPGFRDRVLARHVMTPADLERSNPNYVGGDIGAGISDIPQFAIRPTRWLYSTPVRGLYLCSASTPPGVGVHGMCGYHAAKRAIHDVFQ